jgi:hypothetical protein
MWNTLFTLFDRYGPIPRLLFEELLPPKTYRTGMVEDGTGKDDVRLQQRIAEYEELLARKIQEAMKLVPNVLLSTEYGMNCSHTVFTMRPCKMEGYKYVSLRAVFGFATEYIAHKIGDATIGISLKDAQRYYDFLLSQGATRTAAGWMFESRMHQIFQRGGPFVATKQGALTTITIDIDQKCCNVFFKVSEIGDLLRKQSGSRRINPAMIGGYFKPQQCNLPSVDSFAISKCAATGNPVLVLFQMTVSTEHSVKAEGLASIWAVIPQELRETPPILVFVVSADVANTFASKRQTISGAANDSSAGKTPASNTTRKVASKSSASRSSASNPPRFPNVGPIRSRS